MDQHASGIQYNSSQKVLKWGQPSDLILKAILNCVTLSKVDLITEMDYHVSVCVVSVES